MPRWKRTIKQSERQTKKICLDPKGEIVLVSLSIFNQILVEIFLAVPKKPLKFAKSLYLPKKRRESLENDFEMCRMRKYLQKR